MEMRSHWLAPALFAVALGVLATMAPAHAQDSDRVLLGAPDLVFRDRAPRDDGRDADRPEIRRDAYGRPIYFRYIPLDEHRLRNGPPYGSAQDGRRARPRTWRRGGGNAACRREGNCKDRIPLYFDGDDRDRRGEEE